MAKKPSTPPPTQPSMSFEKALPVLKGLLTKGRELLGAGSITDAQLNAWTNMVRSYLEAVFGSDGRDVFSFARAGVRAVRIIGGWSDDEPEDEGQILREELQAKIESLESIVGAIETRLQLEGPAIVAVDAVPPPKPVQSNEVFIVHGHDDAAKSSVARLLERLGLTPVILHERPNGGKTVIEKLEANAATVGFAVVLLTPDDVGNKPGEPSSPRARQNVILEMGYFVGRLGRNRVCVLYRKGVELPSDLLGVVYTPLDGGWEFPLAKELREAGFKIDLNKL